MRTRELIIFLFVFFLVSPVFALDMGYYGFVTIDGETAPDGTVVSVWVGSTQVGSSTIPYHTAPSGSGYYKIKIPQEYSGTIAEFRVDISVATTVTLSEGSHYLNLTVVGPFCGDATCDPDENCESCPADCTYGADQVCCGGTVYYGNCCVDDDCSGGTCVSHDCTYGGGGSPPGGGSPGSYCGDATCDDDEDCSSCPGDCECESGETCCDGECEVPACESDSDCDDGNACTIDICSGVGCSATCYHESITVCQSGDNCCPTGCSTATDDDCGCVNECATGAEKCEDGVAYICEQDSFDCWKWSETQTCAEGCCDDVCCGTVGLSGAAVTGGTTSVLPFFILIMGILAYASFHYYRRNR